VQLTVQLPTRIDPDEEKRLQVLRQKIKKAEILREQAEQEYVAYRAHYVGKQHELVQQTGRSKAQLEWLQAICQQRSVTVGFCRVRLQMTRDVLAASRQRSRVLLAAAVAVDTAAAGTTTTSSSSAAPAPKSTSDDMDIVKVNEDDNGNVNSTTNTPGTVTPVAVHATRSTDVDEMLTVWNQIEDDFKAAVIACRQVSTTGKKKKDAVLSWKATKLTATPTNVPLLVSAISKVPEKSLAWKCSGVFGSKPESLLWMESHLPDAKTVKTTKVSSSTESAAARVDSSAEEIEALRMEVEFISRELEKERNSSKSYAHKIGQLRAQNDEWVAMMGLVRQETESVLHRHHILLESDMAVQASERLHHEHEEERIAEETAHMDEEPLTQPHSGDENVPAQEAPSAEDTGVPTVVAAVDEANDGDDEDSNDDDDEELQGNTAAWETGKRPPEDRDGESPSGRKRRKI
jgi:hypothetical protein